MRFYIVAALLLVSTSLFAQTEGAIEMLRHDIKTEKVAIMTASLPLTEKEGEAFWQRKPVGSSKIQSSIFNSISPEHFFLKNSASEIQNSLTPPKVSPGR